jgi:rfaE bifunctional protein nucleotidyltransferase chain/domain
VSGTCHSELGSESILSGTCHSEFSSESIMSGTCHSELGSESILSGTCHSKRSEESILSGTCHSKRSEESIKLNSKKKIMLISLDKLINICSNLKSEGNTIVFTNGCFDIIHRGHVTYLEEAKNLGDVLIIGLNSDDSVRRLKGESRPVNSQDDRAVVLSALRSVDYVIIFYEDTPFELISSLNPDILVKGGDYTPENIIGADIVTSNGGKVVVIPLVPGKSTTSIIDKLKN